MDGDITIGKREEKDQMADDPAIECFLTEYSEMRQELRDLITSMDTNCQIGIAAVTLVMGVGLTQYPVIIVFVPSVIFAFSMIHLLKVAGANIIGTYCQVIAGRLKAKLGADNILMDWEGGRMSKHMSQPSGVVQWGFYLFFLALVIAFTLLSWKAFYVCHWSLLIHAIEFVIAIGYAWTVTSWSSPQKRAEIMQAYACAEPIGCSHKPATKDNNYDKEQPASEER